MSTAPKAALNGQTESFRRILGLSFFTGNAAEAVHRMNTGGLLVVPAAPALKDLPFDAEYREALVNADLVITDSSFMVLVWNLLQHDDVPRLSGLTYMRQLLTHEDFKQPGRTFWVMASERSARRNIAWLNAQGLPVSSRDVYIAPMYGASIADVRLLARVNPSRPAHIVITIGGGTQERLGLYLKRHLDFRPAIHCTGAAMAFLSGDQVRIPAWADRAYLGWLIRCLSQPERYVARYWGARRLLPLLVRYRDKLPDLQ